LTVPPQVLRLARDFAVDIESVAAAKAGAPLA
jgi:hypothetical protein